MKCLPIQKEKFPALEERTPSWKNARREVKNRVAPMMGQLSKTESTLGAFSGGAGRRKEKRKRHVRIRSVGIMTPMEARGVRKRSFISDAMFVGGGGWIGVLVERLKMFSLGKQTGEIKK